MKGQIRSGQVAGIPVSIHWTFLLLLLWIAAINIFSGQQTEGFIWSLLLFIALFVSIFAHELGHAIMAAVFNVRISSILLLPTGTINRYRSLPPKKWQAILILSAGPIVNLILAVCLSFFINPFQAYWDAPETIGSATRSNFLFQWEIINLALCLINVLPAFPLDGGAILQVLLSYKIDEKKASSVVLTISNIVSWAFIMVGTVYTNLLLILFGSFILVTSKTPEKYFESAKTKGIGIMLPS